LQTQHGDKIAELKELERAIEAAESAVEAGREEVRHEAGVFDPHKFNQLAAPVQRQMRPGSESKNCWEKAKRRFTSWI